ncbi:MAG: hypothetical protein M3498_05090 [Deinococcota bacterium]|jgi:hypothetical protein|nr:hypothetical protein [Deinococcota bacterium]
MDVGELLTRVDQAWSEMTALLGDQDYRYGPPILLKYELEKLGGCIQSAKEGGDPSELQRCLDELVSHIKRLKLLSAPVPAQ